MSNILNATAAIIVLCLAIMGSAQAHANYHDYHAWSRPNDAMLASLNQDTVVRIIARALLRSFRPLQRRDTLITQPRRPIVCRALTSLAPSTGEVSLALRVTCLRARAQMMSTSTTKARH